MAVKEEDIERLKLDVPAIIYIEVRSPYVLQDISPESIDEISSIKVNPFFFFTFKTTPPSLIRRFY